MEMIWRGRKAADCQSGRWGEESGERGGGRERERKERERETETERGERGKEIGIERGL